jgi:K+-sensing histidine kinase KdpD
MTRLGLGLVDEVTNDLRPPLTVVKGSLETVLSNWEVLDASQREELLGAALKSANELASGVEMLEARLGAVEQALDRDAPTSSLLLTLEP